MAKTPKSAAVSTPATPAEPTVALTPEPVSEPNAPVIPPHVQGESQPDTALAYPIS